MEKCGVFCDSSSPITTELTTEKCTTSESNVEQSKSEKLRKLSEIQKYRSTYLKRYVYAKEVNRRRHFKKTFVVPAFHVKRKPDNPFNVKNVVQNLRKGQMTSPANRISDENQHLSVGEKDSCK